MAVSLTLMTAAAVVFICSVLYVRLAQVAHDEDDRYLFEVANGASAIASARIQSLFNALDSIGKAAFQLQDKTLARHFLHDKAALYGFDQIAVTDIAARTVSSDNRTKYLHEQPFIAAALRGNTQIVRAKNSFADGVNEIVYAAPVYENDEFMGIVSAWHTVEHFSETFQESHFTGKGFAQLSDGEGNLLVTLVHEGAPVDVHNFFDLLKNRGTITRGALEEMRADMLLEKKGRLDFALDTGPEMVLHYVPLQQKGLYLLSAIPSAAVNTATGVATRGAMIATGGIVLSFLVLLLIGFNMYRKYNKKLAEMTLVDGVTGGGTRTSFDREAQKKIKEAPPETYALVSLNIEKFKLVNHLFGIEAADKMLKDIYDNLSRCMNEDELLCRDYADTFTLLVKFKTKNSLLADIERFSHTINAFNQGQANRYYLRVSLGVYCIDNPFASLPDIRDRAVFARKSHKAAIMGDLYKCVFYSDIDHLQMVKIKDIENKMEDALAKGDFHIRLQPKVALKNNTIVGAEALVRWHDGDNGLIPPSDFIPFFESIGFIIKLDMYVFRGVCVLLRKWLDSGIAPVPVSVNLSRTHLADPDSISKYAAIRDRYALPGNLLELELTESLDYGTMGALTRFVDQIKAHGFRCSLDDFGSGYSSLNTLKDIDVDTLKLDRAFWASPTTDNTRERIIIRSLVQLAKKLGMATVSEGVETPAQIKFLKEIHCDMAQGYAFFKPLAPKEFEKCAYGR